MYEVGSGDDGFGVALYRVVVFGAHAASDSVVSRGTRMCRMPK